MEMELIEDASVADGSPSKLEVREERVERTTVGEEQTRGAPHTRIMPKVSVIDPTIWSPLPKELIRLVFAHLPLPLLLSLRRLSSSGKWDINLNDAEFNRLCAKNHSNLCAFILHNFDYIGGEQGHYKVVVVHSVDSTAWQSVKINVDGPFDLGPHSSDGGLVCFAIRVRSNVNDNSADFSLVILVVNPLTGDCRQLPEHGVHPAQFNMIQLVMDRDTKRYKVILLFDKLDSVGDQDRTVIAMLFDSGDGVWTNSKDSPLDLFLGLQYLYVHQRNHNFYDPDHELAFNPCAFDCATGNLFRLNFDRQQYDQNFVFVKDRLFMLPFKSHEVPKYRLSEYQIIEGQKDGSSLIKLKDHSFGPIDYLKVAHLRVHRKSPWLRACNGFLLITGNLSNTIHTTVTKEFAWLYNLSTGDCVDLRKQREPGRQFAWNPDVFCELRWDAVP